MINKNKEEIKKIKKEMNHMFDSGIDYKYVRQLVIQLDERIKTSILWCEDEIKFLKRLKECNYPIEPRGRLFEFITVEKRVEQLQTHLKWLKEQEQTE